MSWFIRPLIQAFSLYSRIPMPKVKWEDTHDGRILIYFPLVGTLIGAVMSGWLFLCGILSIPVTAAAFVLVAIPIIITGGIHLDGFIDTADARHSFGDREKRLAILSDPHVGAFGVIRLILYILVALAAVVVILQGADNTLMPIQVLTMTFSRTLSGWTSVTWQGAKKDGMLRSVAGDADGNAGHQGAVRIVLAVEAIAVGAAMIVISPIGGAIVVVACLAMMGIYYLMAMKDFGGVTGDLAGWFLCMTELIASVAMAVFITAGF